MPLNAQHFALSRAKVSSSGYSSGKSRKVATIRESRVEKSLYLFALRQQFQLIDKSEATTARGGGGGGRGGREAEGGNDNISRNSLWQI